jgi:tetratricopeptide (TPR) repeat protein
LLVQLAVAQVLAGDDGGYRRTRQELLRRGGPEANAALLGLLLGQTPQNVGSLALAARVAARPSSLDRNRWQFAAARACQLKPDAEVLPELLSLGERTHPVHRASALCRLKRYDEAAVILQQQQQQYPMAGLYLALVEANRGNWTQAEQALDAATRSDRSNWAWEDQQPFELLRREVESLLQPPRMEKVP